MKKLMLVIAVVLVWALMLPVACAKAPEPMTAPRPAPAPAPVINIPPAAESAGGAPQIVVSNDFGTHIVMADEERMIIRNGDMSLVVKSHTTPRIQETHILVGHIICELVDYILFQQGIPKSQNPEP